MHCLANAAGPKKDVLGKEEVLQYVRDRIFKGKARWICKYKRKCRRKVVGKGGRRRRQGDVVFAARLAITRAPVR